MGAHQDREPSPAGRDWSAETVLVCPDGSRRPIADLHIIAETAEDAAEKARFVAGMRQRDYEGLGSGGYAFAVGRVRPEGSPGRQ